MTHIGIIRALEENNIPIDYITGTSMGAIIGSLYAMGILAFSHQRIEIIGTQFAKIRFRLFGADKRRTPSL